MRAHNVAKIQRKFSTKWTWVCNYAYSPIGRMWVGWQHNEVKVNVISQSQRLLLLILIT